jgi:hypothetical protein
MDGWKELQARGDAPDGFVKIGCPDCGGRLVDNKTKARR